MIALALIIVVLPLLPALAAAVTGRARTLGLISAAAGIGALALAIALAIDLSAGHPVQALSGFIYLDPLSGFFLATIALVVALSSFGSAAYLRAEEERGELSSFQVRLYFIFFALFASMMLGSFETGNLGLLWVLIEASTLASCVLVGLEAKAVSLEAAWKYIIISSFGVTMALVGTLFLYYAAGNLTGSPTEHLTWSFLFAHAGALQHQSLRLAFLLVLIGYGTKVGLAPMHTWLPDAHSEAPSPASAMLSAALLNTGMYAIIRFQALTKPALGAGYASHALLIFGFASALVGALFIVLRGNFKRMFAYSSIEQMGIIAIALGFGGTLGYYGALLQILTHAIGKAVLFLTSGDIVLRLPDPPDRRGPRRAHDHATDRRRSPPGRAGRGRLAAVRPVPIGVHDRAGGPSAFERRARRGAAPPDRDRVHRARRRRLRHGPRTFPGPADRRPRLHRALEPDHGRDPAPGRPGRTACARPVDPGRPQHADHALDPRHLGVRRS